MVPTIRKVCRAAAGLLVSAMFLQAPIAVAQSSSMTTADGIEISVTGGQSQSISTTPDGAEITLDGRVILIEGTLVSVDGSSIDQGKLDTVGIDLDGNTLKIFIDGKLVMQKTSSSRGGSDEAVRLNNEGVKYYKG